MTVLDGKRHRDRVKANGKGSGLWYGIVLMGSDYKSTVPAVHRCDRCVDVQQRA